MTFCHVCLPHCAIIGILIGIFTNRTHLNISKKFHLWAGLQTSLRSLLLFRQTSIVTCRCALTDSPAVYVETKHHLSWIEDVIRRYGGA